MRYLSIDTETTGLDENEHQLIEFAAIIEDSKNPKSYEESKKYRRIILSPDRIYKFSSFAAKLNTKLMNLIADIESGKKFEFENNTNLTTAAIYPEQLIGDFKQWLYVNGFEENKGVIEVVAAGKNFGSFDRKFIQAIPQFQTYGLKFHHRAIDPSSMYIDWGIDKVLPSTEQCKERAGIFGEVKHEALADAWDVIQMIRPHYGKTHFY